MNAIELFSKDGKSTGFFICGKCQTVTLNPLFSFRGDNVEPQNTREAAEMCCRDPVCTKCGKEFRPFGWQETPMCSECSNAEWAESRQQEFSDNLAKATEVPSCDGMVYWEARDKWYGSLDEAASDDDGPDWVFCTIPSTRELNIEDALQNELERLCEDGYEDMDVSVDAELRSAIQAFNERNKSELTVWTADLTRKIRVVRALGVQTERSEL